MSMVGWRHRAVKSLLVGARSVAANTPVNNWKATALAKQGLFRFAYRKNQLVQFRGMSLKVPSTDVSCVPGLVAGYYESISLNIFESLASQAKVVVDIGGGLGVYAIEAARAMSGEGAIICFEPEVSNYELIAGNFVLNNISNAMLVREAVCDRSGDGVLYVSPRNSGGASLARPRHSRDAGQTVKLTTLDGFCGSHGINDVDLVKIDVEGYEADVLRGATRTLSTRPSILLEFVSDVTRQANRTLEDVAHLLTQLYCRFLVIDEVRRHTHWVDADQLVRIVSRRASLNVLAIERPEHLAALRDRAVV
jgi:FkbM family methyltransferase